MIPERQKICESCNYIWTDGKHCCKQPYYPLNKEEYDLIGATPKDVPTLETLEKLMDISMKPKCKKRMLQENSLDYYLRSIRRR